MEAVLFDLTEERSPGTYKLSVTRLEVLNALLDAATACTECTIEDLLSPSRKKKFVQARRVVIYILRRRIPAQTGHTYTLDEIGKILGNRHHVTIMGGRDKAIYLLDSGDKTFTLLVHNIARRASDEILRLNKSRREQ